jgi:hypothetical protein
LRLEGCFFWHLGWRSHLPRIGFRQGQCFYRCLVDRHALQGQNANTTEQVAESYKELKMEIGAACTSVMGISERAKGGVGLDTLVQRLIQTAVWDIDSKYK